MIGIRHVIRSNRVDWVNNESTVTPACRKRRLKGELPVFVNKLK